MVGVAQWRIGLNSKNETLGKGTLSRERNCKWQRNEWGGIRRNSAHGGGAAEEVRQHCGAVTRTGCASAPALQVAGATGSGRGTRGVAGAELTGVHAAQGGPPAEAAAGGKDIGSGFFQRCLAKNRGSTPAERKLWRDGIYDEPWSSMTRTEGQWDRCWQ